MTNHHDSSNPRHGRVLLLTTPHSYRAAPFVAAAGRLGVEAIQVVDTPAALAEAWGEDGQVVGLPFQDLDGAIARLAAFAREKPVDAVLGVDDRGSLLAARTAAALGLPHNAPGAAAAARNKYLMRQLLKEGGGAVPWFQRFELGQDFAEILAAVRFPAVVKPLELSGSRGVMRVDDPAGLEIALARLARLLDPHGDGGGLPFLIEGYIPGVEVALEGLLDGGRLRTLALFDKPDPLEGPFFEETIYVTPSRLPAADQAAIAACAEAAARALGLQIGPVHAELRLNEDGPWLVEVAGRSIGGLCSQTLRFEAGASLEELILRQACGLPLPDAGAAGRASGVMMIPIPEPGILRRVDGLAAAEAVPLVDEINITARLNYPLVPLPEGESYLGFIFASGEEPAAVEAALRAAHGRLSFDISPHFVLQTR